VSARRALILALGDYGPEQLPAEVRQPVVALLLRWYRDDPDPGVHGAIDWLLRHGKEGPTPRPLDWRQAEALAQIDAELALERRQAQLGVLFAAGPRHPLDVVVALGVPPTDAGGRRWYVTATGLTLAIVPQPEPFLMGSPPWEAGRLNHETQHLRRIGRSFALATRPVTVRQYEQFLREYPEFRFNYPKQASPELETPIIAVSWYDATAYCRWLSEQEGVPLEQMCYPPIAEIAKARRDPVQTPLKLPSDWLARTGYRLPTEAEWEYACRAGAVTSRYYGSAEELLPRYAWYPSNAQDRTWPVGQKRPNDLGLFDMQGNVWQWCQDAARLYQPDKANQPIEDEEDVMELTDRLPRLLRGGSFARHAAGLRSACRNNNRPSNYDSAVGLRPARTCR
jgi:formylglycine-generating enzyme required for sulfatase activity